MKTTALCVAFAFVLTVAPCLLAAEPDVIEFDSIVKAAGVEYQFYAAPDDQRTEWWAKVIPGSRWIPAGSAPEFDKYITVSPPKRKLKNGDYIRDEVVAKGWDATLKTFYITLLVKPENPIRVYAREIPGALPAKPMSEKHPPAAPILHSDCKILDIVEDGRLWVVAGKVGLAIFDMPRGGIAARYIVGLPGSKLDVTAYKAKPISLAGRTWRATSPDAASIMITPTEILLANVVEER